MWTEDDYVDAGGGSDGANSVPRTPRGKSAARAIGQKREMQSHTVKLPKNPFIDNEDYADMTGHQRDENDMEKLRSAHQYKSMKVRNPSTTRRPSEADSEEMKQNDSDVELSRNFSTTSSSRGSRSCRLKKTNTSPGGNLTENFQDERWNGSVEGIQPVIEETNEIEVHENGNATGDTSSFSQRLHSLKKAPGTPQPPVPSPARSGVSVETTTTVVKSTPTAPTLIYKSSSESTIDPEVTVVIEEIGPTSHTQASFATHAGSEKSDAKSFLKFEAPPRKLNVKDKALLTLAVVIIVGLVAVIGYLGVTTNQQRMKINLLQEKIRALLSSEESTFLPIKISSTSSNPIVASTLKVTSTVSPADGATSTVAATLSSVAKTMAATTNDATVTALLVTKQNTTVVAGSSNSSTF